MLFKNSVIYLIGRIIPSAINFAMVALVTRIMSPEEYGKYAIVVVSGTAGVLLGAMWLNMAALRLYTKNDDKKPLLWSLFVGFGAIMALGIVFCVGLALWLGNAETSLLIFLGFVLFAATAWHELNLHLMQAKLDAMSYVIQSIARATLGSVIGGLLAWFGWGAVGILIGTILGTVIPAVPMTIRQWRELSFARRHPETMREVLAYGIPLSMGFTLQAVVNSTDRFFVQILNGTAALGLYAVGFDTADRIIRALSQPLNAASLPLAISRMETEGPEGARQQCGQNLVVLLLVTLPACLGLIAVTPELVDLVVGEAFRPMAKIIVPLVSIASILQMMRANYFDHALHIGMKPKRQVVVFGIVAVANAILNFFMIKAYGVVGAGYATIIAFAIGLVASYLVGRDVFRLPLMPLQVAQITAASLVMMVVTMYLPVPGGPLVGLLAKTLVGGVTYAALILAFDVHGMRQQLTAFSQRAVLRGSR